jgi:hypothetical protein
MLRGASIKGSRLSQATYGPFRRHIPMRPDAATQARYPRDVDDALPLVDREVLDRRAVDDPGVVHENIELSELACDSGHRGFPLVGVGDVQMHVASRAADLTDQSVAEDINDEHCGILCGEDARMRRTHPACTAVTMATLPSTRPINVGPIQCHALHHSVMTVRRCHRCTSRPPDTCSA